MNVWSLWALVILAPPLLLGLAWLVTLVVVIWVSDEPAMPEQDYG